MIGNKEAKTIRVKYEKNSQSSASIIANIIANRPEEGKSALLWSYWYAEEEETDDEV